jgi:quercetin dioxygenase-like cupin family protein
MPIVKSDEGREFRFFGDTVTIKTSSKETNGAYSLMHWAVPAGASAVPHAHEFYEETFYILSGELEVLLGKSTQSVSAGDFIRVPAGARHGFSNKSEDVVHMLVSLTPGGMEELFYKFRDDGPNKVSGNYADEARRFHNTEYEYGS